MASAVRIVFARDHLGLVREEDLVPLRPDLYLAAVARFGSDRVVDVADILPERAMRSYWASSLRDTRKFLRLVQDSDDALLGSAGTFLLEVGLLLFRFGVDLFTELGRRYREIRLTRDWSDSGPWVPNMLPFLMQCLYSAALHCRDQGLRFAMDDDPLPAPAMGWRAVTRGCSRGLRVSVGHVLHRIGPHPLLAASGDAKRWEALPQGAGVVLGGIQLTDVALQPPLAAALARRDGLSTVWIRGEPTKQLESGEAASLRHESRMQRVVEFNEVPEIRWRNWFFVACSGAAVRAGLRRVWQAAAPRARWSREAIEYLFTTTGVMDPALQWYRMDRMMKAIRPRLVIGNSAIHDMGTLAAWTRRHRVPLVLLPHGFPADPSHLHHAGCGDVHVMFGPGWDDLLVRGGIVGDSSRVSNGGRMFLPPRTTTSSTEMASRPRRVVFLENCDMANPMYLFTARQYVEWFRAIGAAAREAGWELVLRGHPRKPPGTFYEDVAAELRAGGVRCEVDRSPDLERTVRSARLVVVRLLDTAVVRAVLAGTPMIGFSLVRLWRPRERWMARLGPYCRDKDRMVAYMRRAEDPVWCSQELARQQERLRVLVDYDNAGGYEQIAETAAICAREPGTSWRDAWNRTRPAASAVREPVAAARKSEEHV